MRKIKAQKAVQTKNSVEPATSGEYIVGFSKYEASKDRRSSLNKSFIIFIFFILASVSRL